MLCSSGERLPTLVNAETGLPIFEATVFCLMEKRATDKMRMTLGQVLRSIRAEPQIFEHLGIDIDERMAYRTRRARRGKSTENELPNAMPQEMAGRKARAQAEATVYRLP